MNHILQIVRLLRPYWRFIAQSLLVGVMITFLSLPGPFITKLLIDEVFPHRDYSLLYFVLIMGAVFSAFTGLTSFMSSYFSQCVSTNMSFDFETDFYSHIQSLDFSFFDKRETGEIMARFGDMQSSMFSIIRIVNMLVMNCLQLMIFPLILFYINWKLALISLAVLPFDTLLVAITKKHIRNLSKRIAERSAEMSAKTYESLAGIRAVQALGVERIFFNKIFEIFKEVSNLRLKLSLVQNGSGFAANLFKAAGSMAYGWYGWTQILQGNLSLGSFMAFSGYVGFLYGPIENLIGILPLLETTKVHLNRFFEIYNLRPAIQNRLDMPVLQGVQGHIEFREVSFSYEERHRILHQVNLEIPPRTMIALVGRSGSGKSTLAKLIPRFYDPDEGQVRIDGEDIQKFQLNSLRRQVGFSMQGSPLFQGSILENLTFGRDIPLQDVEDAARSAYIHDFVNTLGDGYDTLVGEQGTKLSEGQKQRIALARVLLLDSSILILDEPTAALDLESEFYIQEALGRVRENRTVVIIAHRLSTIQNADEIVVLEDGRISERGTHGDLLHKGEGYSQLFSRMASI